MTGEELCRKYHELCGWRHINGGWSSPAYHGFKTLPAPHLDANLAIDLAVKHLDGMLPGRCKSKEEFCEAILRELISLKEHEVAKEGGA